MLGLDHGRLHDILDRAPARSAPRGVLVATQRVVDREARARARVPLPRVQAVHVLQQQLLLARALPAREEARALRPLQLQLGREKTNKQNAH